jgi:hypothetical protein
VRNGPISQVDAVVVEQPVLAGDLQMVSCGQSEDLKNRFSIARFGRE